MVGPVVWICSDGMVLGDSGGTGASVSPPNCDKSGRLRLRTRLRPRRNMVECVLGVRDRLSVASMAVAAAASWSSQTTSDVDDDVDNGVGEANGSMLRKVGLLKQEGSVGVDGTSVMYMLLERIGWRNEASETGRGDRRDVAGVLLLSRRDESVAARPRGRI